jgi:hypothetical protein
MRLTVQRVRRSDAAGNVGKRAGRNEYVRVVHTSSYDG